MAKYLIGLMAIVLCMGQNCASTFLTTFADQINGDSTDDGTDDDTGDGTDDGSDDDAAPKGIPEGVYTGVQTTVTSLDRVTDAYPAESKTTTGTSTYTFDDEGRLVGSDGVPIKVGDVELFDTEYGRVAEQVTAVTLATNITEYRTQAQMVMEETVSGLAWQFIGSGIHTYRLSGGKVVYDGQLDLGSDTVAGAAYRLIIDYSATLEE